MVGLNPPLGQNYSIFMRNFQKNQHNTSNNQVQISNRTSLCKFEPPIKKYQIRPCFYYSFYFIYMGQPIWDPYGTRLHSPYEYHMGVNIGPIWVPYRLLAGILVHVPTEERKTAIKKMVMLSSVFTINKVNDETVTEHDLCP